MLPLRPGRSQFCRNLFVAASVLSCALVVPEAGSVPLGIPEARGPAPVSSQAERAASWIARAASGKKGRKKPPVEPAPVPLLPPDPIQADDVLEVSLLEPSVGPLQQGALVSFKYLIKNPTEEVVILREITSGSSEDPGLSFVLSGYGTVIFDEQRDMYLYDSMVQQATPRLFQHGVMLPGESRQLELTMRVLEDRQGITISFNRLPMDAFRRVAFAAIEGGGGREVSFQHLQSLPAGYLKARTVPEGRIQERPFILWEELLTEPILTLEQTYSRGLPLKPLGLTGAQAITSAGIEGAPTYWEWAGGWVVIGERSAALVTPQAMRLMPRVDSRLFRDIDSGRLRLRVKLPAGGEIFKTRFATRQGDGIYTFGEFIEVPRERLWEFFDLARGENYSVVREAYLFDAYYYRLVPLS